MDSCRLTLNLDLVFIIEKLKLQKYNSPSVRGNKMLWQKVNRQLEWSSKYKNESVWLRTTELVQKLCKLHINPTILKWITSYFTMRYQKVVIGEEESETIPVTSGVPQGSVLGPFIISHLHWWYNIYKNFLFWRHKTGTLCWWYVTLQENWPPWGLCGFANGHQLSQQLD